MRTESYGQSGRMSFVDKFGVYLSLAAVRKNLRAIDLSKADLLDLGCGYHGTLLRAFCGQARSVTGVDLKVAKEVKALPNVQIYEANIENICSTLDSGLFDVVTIINVLEHLDSPVTVLKEIHRILKDHGLLLVNVPTWRGKFFLEFSAYKLKLSPKQEIQDHKAYYDKKDLRPLLIQAGFGAQNFKMEYHKFGLNLFVVCRKSV